jgi:prepilin-type processing-associated H-X9-DG protein
MANRSGSGQRVPDRWWYAGNVNPSLKGQIDPKRLDSTSYLYFGWLFNDDTIDLPGGREPSDLAWNVYNDGNVIALVYFQNLMVEPIDSPKRDADMDVGEPYGNNGGAVVYRFREGIERFMITDINNPAASSRAQSEIAVMFDTVSSWVGDYSHVPGGANTLYLDGHVSFLKYPGEFPVSVAWTKVIDVASS